jgi:flagellar motor switch protein FliN/FliY
LWILVLPPAAAQFVLKVQIMSASEIPSATPPVAGPTPASEVSVQAPEFEPLLDDGSGEGTPLERFYDVSVTVWAELGRLTVSLGQLLQLGEGNVLKLDRPISAPVDLMAQGVRIARGEVVVVDDYFAIRIKEIEPSRKTKQ